MSSIDVGLPSEEVMRLVRAVWRLDQEEQERILKLVRLLGLVTPAVREQTQSRLKELVDRRPPTAFECRASVDELIHFLEHSLVTSKALEAWDRAGAAQRWN